MAKAMEAGGKLLTGGGGTAPESGALAGEGADPTPDPTLRLSQPLHLDGRRCYA